MLCSKASKASRAIWPIGINSFLSICTMALLEIYLSSIDERRFQVSVTRSPVGGGSDTCNLPFWQGEQNRHNTIIKILESNGGFRAQDFPEPGEQDWLAEANLLIPDGQHFHPAYQQQIGQRLYQSLFSDNALNQTFQSALRLAERDNERLHLRLKFATNAAERSHLADYPWELLHDGQRFLVLRQIYLSRYIDYEASPPNLPVQTQLRLLLVSSRPQAPGLAQLPEREQNAIRRGLQRASDAGTIQLQTLDSATLDRLSVYLTDLQDEVPQILHFDGHGVYGKWCQNPLCQLFNPGIKATKCRACFGPLPFPKGYLVFENDSGGPDYVSATEFAARLPKTISLVVLSACQSGMAIAGKSVFNGAAQALIDERIPAVVAMQYEVQATAASRFAEQFYRLLGQKRPLVEALGEGRKWMGVDGDQWYRPVLYLHWHDNAGGQLFAESLLPEAAVSSRKMQEQSGQEFSGFESHMSQHPPQELKRRQLMEKYEQTSILYREVMNRMSYEMNPVTEIKLQRQADDLYRQLEEMDAQLKALE